jgi:hypothetical protein
LTGYLLNESHEKKFWPHPWPFCPDLNFQLNVTGDIFRIHAVGLDWDLGGMVYEPVDQSGIPVGPDGRKISAFLIHGGCGDHRFIDDVARLMSGRFRFKVVTMSLPGRLNLNDPSRDWPGDTIHPDGTVRTPIWKQGEVITPDQYEIVQDESARLKYGTLIMGYAKENTIFHARMSGWPVAFEEAGRTMIAKHMPSSEFSVYLHGRSTDGPFSFLLTQRVPYVVGVIVMENTPFGHIFRIQSRPSGNADGLTYGEIVPFNCLQ